MAIKAQRSSDTAPRRPYWADREAAAAPRRRNSRDARRHAAPIAVAAEAIARFEVAVPPQKVGKPRFGRCRVADEVEIVFYKRASSFSCASRPKRAFACWFHTHFIENGVLTLAKSELDKACKCKKASPDLSVSIKFRPPPRSKRAPSPNNVVP